MAQKIKKQVSLLKRIDQTIHTPNWLTALLGLTFTLRIPSFFEPFSYGDEMIYLTLGEGIRRGLTLYQDIHDNKPPLLYYLAAIAGNVFWFRVILAFWMLVTIIIFWKLTKVLFPKEIRVQQIATIIFAILTTIPLLEGQTANAELFMLGPTIGAFLLVLKKNRKPIHYIVGGLLLSVATLFKMPALFDIGAIVFFWIILAADKKIDTVKFFQKYFLLFAGFIIPILLTLIWYTFKGALNDYLAGAFLQNVGYLSSWRPDDQEKSFLVKNAPLIFRGLVVLVGSFILFLARKKLSKQFIFITLWLLFSLFAITLSERPYPHYLIQAVPSISLLVGILIAQKSLEQSLTVFPLFFALAVPVYYKFWSYPVIPYYERFIKFAAGQYTREEYFDQFGKEVNRNYKLATYIQSLTTRDEAVFVWGDSSAVYALSRRLPPIKYVANYHINDFSSKQEVVEALTKDKPSLIVVLSDSPEFFELTPFLYENYVEISSIDNVSVWRLATPAMKRTLE